MLPCMVTGQLYTNGDTSAELRAYKYKDITSDNCRAILALRYSYANNAGIAYFANFSSIVPNITNTTILGSPSLQWNNTYTRNILIDNDINIASSIINKTSTSGSLAIRCGTNYTDGTSIGMYGKDYNSGMAGTITISAYGNSDYTNLCLYPNGTMSVYNNSTNSTKNIAMKEDVDTLLNGKANSSHTHTKSDITDFPTIPSKTSDLTNDSGFITSDNTKIPLSGSNQISGNLIPATDNSYNLGSSNYYWNNGYINNLYTKIRGITAPYLACVPIDYTFGTIPNEQKTGLINLFTDTAGNPNFRIYNYIRTTGDQDFYFYTYSIKDETNAFILRQSYSDNLLTAFTLDGNLGTSQYRWNNIFLVNAPNISSDERVKQQIKSVDDDLIEIWENVKPKQYKLNSSVERKGENARTHIGYIVQDIQKACEEKGIDPTKYSLFCHDSWEEQEEKKDENGQVIEPYKPNGDLYSLRYEEALVVECAYLRRENDKLKQQFKQLEETVNELKSIINYSEIPNS